MPRTSDEIDAEKAAKPAVQHVPPELELAAGRAIGYGVSKHGIATADGWGTWRVAGTQQADPLTHYGCLRRHLAAWRAGEAYDPESGLSHLDHAAAQLAILLDLIARPVHETETLTVGSAFAAGAIEGEKPRGDPGSAAWSRYGGCDCPTPKECHAIQRCAKGLR